MQIVFTLFFVPGCKYLCVFSCVALLCGWFFIGNVQQSLIILKIPAKPVHFTISQLAASAPLHKAILYKCATQQAMPQRTVAGSIKK